MNALRSIQIALVVAALVSASVGFAQQPPGQRVVGAIERVDETALTIRSDGGPVKVSLTPNAAVFGVTKATISDVKPGAFIGVGAMPQGDGSQRAIQVTIFAESQRGLGEGHRPWDRAPNSTMTNATVEETVTSVDGQVVMVRYQGGEKKVVIPSDATILAYSQGDRSDLKAGAHVAIVRAVRKPDGKLEADRINVGRGGVIPR